jgi:bifunctional DNA-binding transcriptional regulator/antitoxin component of YhaV-PrlF toxin-antitoxin module
MEDLPTSIELVVEEGGVVTLPDPVVRHLGLEPGMEAPLDAVIEADGRVILAAASPDGSSLGSSV